MQRILSPAPSLNLFICFGLLLLYSWTIAQAQNNTPLDPCSSGTLYYIAYPDTVTNTQDSRFAADYAQEFFLYIYSPVTQKVTIGRANGAGLSESIIGGQILEFDTKKVAVPLIREKNMPQTNILKVESKSPIVVYAYMATRFGCAAFTPLPVELWGTEYYAAAWPGEYVRDITLPRNQFSFDIDEAAPRKVPAPAFITVIAASDSTEVTISPTDDLLSCSGCGTVSLNAGEAYMVQSIVDTSLLESQEQADIGGLSIVANKRIGVLSGNTRLAHTPVTDSALVGNSASDLAAEWLRPVGTHGQHFVFMPTMDDLRQRPGTEVVREKEFVRIYPTTETRTDVEFITANGDSASAHAGQLVAGQYASISITDLTEAVLYQTSEPSQAYQSPEPVVAFNGTTGSGNLTGSSYKAWSTYMVEMVPREQWGSFAPFKAPSYPSGMRHYLNLVTDSAHRSDVYLNTGTARQRFTFTEEIPGTDLVRGTVVVNPGVNYTVEGENGAEFGGFVYGNWGGYEAFRLAPQLEYEENVAMMYGYPLASSSCLLASPDTYGITIEQNCDVMTITLDATNQDPTGLMFLRLSDDPDLTENTRLEFVEPASALELREEAIAEATIRLVAIDPLRDAKGVIEFRDRTREGEVARIEFLHEAERVDLSPVDGIDFGTLSINSPASDQVGEKFITITNPLVKDIVINGLDLRLGTEEFVITKVEPSFNWGNPNDSITLKSGESLKVWVDITPKRDDYLYEDSLAITLGCSEVSVPLRATTTQVCLQVGDLDFGSLPRGQSKTLPLELCNLGQGRITFHDSTGTGGGDILTWLRTEFSVSDTDIQRLRNTVLEEGDCITIDVTFRSNGTGDFRTTARFWANTRDCRDTSVWRARVVQPGPQITSYDWRGTWLSSRAPCTKNDQEQYLREISVINDGTAGFEIAGLAITGDPDNVFSIVDPGDVVPGTIIQPGSTHKVKVAFSPLEQKTYSANIRLYYRAFSSVDSIDAFLDGIGIESCLQVNDVAFIADSTVSPPQGTRKIALRSTGTRPVTITNLSFLGPDAADFSFVNIPPAFPFVIPPGDTLSFSIRFLPSGTLTSERRATLSLEGDFAYADCAGSCSDSAAELTGRLGVLSVEEGTDLSGYELSPISPNPFSGKTEIRFQLGRPGLTTAEIHDAAGRKVATLVNALLHSGEHRITWDGEGSAAGVYYLRITSGSWSRSHQIVVLK